MRIHTDRITPAQLFSGLPSGVELLYTPHASRSRAHAYEVSLRGFGARHTRRSNGGNCGAAYGFAATYSDWGRWIAELFSRDHDAIIGPYKGHDDYHDQTGHLYFDPATLPALAREVRDLRTSTDYLSRRGAIQITARKHGISEWLLERALFGEL